MDRLEEKHVAFLRLCAKHPTRIHPAPSDISYEDMEQMANESLLVKYSKPTGRFFAIGRYGSQFVKENLGNPEFAELAEKYVMSKGYDEQAAKEIVLQQGVDTILQTQAEELRQGAQKEVTVPTNEFGKPEMKFKG